MPHSLSLRLTAIPVTPANNQPIKCVTCHTMVRIIRIPFQIRILHQIPEFVCIKKGSKVKEVGPPTVAPPLNPNPFGPFPVSWCSDPNTFCLFPVSLCCEKRLTTESPGPRTFFLLFSNQHFNQQTVNASSLRVNVFCRHQCAVVCACVCCWA